MRHPNILCRDKAILLIVDVQERFRSHILDFDNLTKNINVLVQSAALMDVPVVVTEQYPAGLGKTVSEIQACLDRLDSYEYFEKSCFSAFEDEGLIGWFAGSRRKQVILTGIETHVCVNQTAHDLIQKGYQVHLVSDAVSSRTAENRRIGMEKIATAGGVISSVEMALFEMLTASGTELFKSVQSLVK